jgi:hypothetical protein
VDLNPNSPGTSRGEDAVVVFVDHLCKMCHLPAKTVTQDIAMHSVSQRDVRFQACFCRSREMAKLFAFKLSMSTAKHPHTHVQVQTENSDGVLEDTFCCAMTAELRALVAHSRLCHGHCMKVDRKHLKYSFHAELWTDFGWSYCSSDYLLA